jgi:hypothetical protein
MNFIPFIFISFSSFLLNVASSPIPDKQLERIHRRFEQEFGESAGNGMSRIIRIHSIKDTRLFAFQQRNETWDIKEVDLIGLLTDKPIIHHTPIPASGSKFDIKKLAREAAVRKANEFEIAAIAKVKHDGVLVTQEGKDEIRMVGALRATQNCLNCHIQRGSNNKDIATPFKVGDVLGALTYRILRRTNE